MAERIHSVEVHSSLGYLGNRAHVNFNSISCGLHLLWILLPLDECTAYCLRGGDPASSLFQLLCVVEQI
jgi:hypothetical protein